jgi:hypothetical protein
MLSFQEWVDLIQTGLDAPEDSFPHVGASGSQKKAWICNWLVMSAEPQGHDLRKIIEALKDPPEWLTKWLDLKGNKEELRKIFL